MATQPLRSSPRPISKQGEEAREPSFTCTMCWRPQHPPSKPKLLGSSARIVCRACWKAVLNLSICWVCGEYIVRGDEVVSLGWCFWHRACFGCLVCGMRMCVPGSVSGVGSGGKVVDLEERKERMGIELEEIPLCNVCSVEMAGETEGSVLGRGLDHVSKFDGGLSRERLQKWSELDDEDVGILPKPLKPSEEKGQKQTHRSNRESSRRSRTSDLIGNFHARLHSAMNTRISGDGSEDVVRYDHLDHEASQAFVDDENPDIYLSIYDPIGEPAFKPSKTKPLPKWMHLLPNNFHRERDQDQGPLKATVGPPARYNTAENSFAKAESGPSDSSALSGNVTPTAPHIQKDLPTPPLDIPTAQPNSRIGARIGFEPHPKVNPVHGRRGHRSSHTFDSTYMTPPEYPRPKTPFPGAPRPVRSLSKQLDASYFSHKPSQSNVKSSWDTEDMCCGLAIPSRVSTPISEEVMPPSRPFSPASQRSGVPPSQSSEFLERYRPKSVSIKHEYIAKEPESILNKMKRQVAEEKRSKRHSMQAKRSPRMEDEEYHDPRRNDLNQELRSLFRET